MSQVIQHFLNPRNCGDLESPDGIGIEYANPWFIKIRVAIKVEDGRIADIRFRTAGCITAVASMSALTELVRQRSLEDALALESADIANALGDVPKEKLHCCDLAIRSLRRAIWNCRKEQDERIAAGPRL